MERAEAVSGATALIVSGYRSDRILLPNGMDEAKLEKILTGCCQERSLEYGEGWSGVGRPW